MSNQSKPPRRQVAFMGSTCTIQLDYRNPYGTVFWSIAYGGMGHILLHRYIAGYILLTAEVLLNYASQLNLSVYYTISGRFDNARSVLDTRWFALYMVIYCFAILDTYRETIIINNAYRLADRENAKIPVLVGSPNSFSILNKISPFMAMLLSMIIPGGGDLAIKRMNRAMLLMGLWTVTASLSGFYSSMTLTFAGQFEAAKQALNIQWFLNIPSLWCFSVYEAYHLSIENNSLFRRELKQYLQTDYQPAGYALPIGGL